MGFQIGDGKITHQPVATIGQLRFQFLDRLGNLYAAVGQSGFVSVTFHRIAPTLLQIRAGDPGGNSSRRVCGDTQAGRGRGNALYDIAAPCHHLPAGIGIGRAQRRTTANLVEIASQEHAVCHRDAIDNEDWPFAFDGLVDFDWMGQGGRVTIARDQVELPQVQRHILLECGCQNGEGWAIGLAVVEDPRHAGSLSSREIRRARSVRPSAQHARVAGRA